ncbi:MAG: TIGR02281 family clan AA aspartic protease [Rhodobacteraceae bacterium]|nr:TIGR02281 family clan AA aspartic protease [Paracoccaceae bacterium]
MARFGYLALLLLAVGSYAVAEFRRRPGRALQQVMVWGFIFVGLIAGFGLWSDIRREVLPVQSVGAAGRLEVPIAPDGHFYILATLNGVGVRFAVDTGASDIVLSARDATRIGLDPARLSYYQRAQTANGSVETAPVLIATMALGGIAERDVPAVVNRGDMEGSLLGMAYLTRFSRVEMTPRLLVLER